MDYSKLIKITDSTYTLDDSTLLKYFEECSQSVEKLIQNSEALYEYELNETPGVSSPEYSMGYLGVDAYKARVGFFNTSPNRPTGGYDRPKSVGYGVIICNPRGYDRPVVYKYIDFYSFADQFNSKNAKVVKYPSDTLLKSILGLGISEGL